MAKIPRQPPTPGWPPSQRGQNLPDGSNDGQYLLDGHPTHDGRHPITITIPRKVIIPRMANKIIRCPVPLDYYNSLGK